MRARPVVPVVVVAVLALAACGRPPAGGEAAPGAASAGVAQAKADLTASDPETGATLRVTGVDVRDEGVVLQLVVANANTEQALVLADDDDPMVLEDETGQTYKARAFDVELGSLTSAALTVEFAGKAGKDAGSFILRVNPESHDSYDEPALTVESIPAEDTELPAAPAFSIAVSDRVAHHPNGLSLTVRRIAFRRDTTEVAVRVVNGSPDRVQLNSSRMVLEDDEGRSYLLVPPNANPELAIPGRQRLSGTLRFVGRPGPTARSLTLVVNRRGNPTYEGASDPALTVPDLPVRR